jgi:hypothetical protein
MFTCPNPSCGRVFAMPLKTLNVQDSSGPYPACPFCLTRIVDSQTESSKSENQGESRSSKEKKNKNKEKPEACHYHLGYLSERQGNEQIPDDCMVCKGVIECMLQKMKTSQA